MLSHRGRYRGVEVSVVEGDILEAGSECIAVSGSSQGKMGGGVSGAVRRRAGQEVEWAAENAAPIHVGTSVLLPAHALARAGVRRIGYASVMNKPIDSTNAGVIGRAVLDLLHRLDVERIGSVSIPLMGTGIGRLPKAVAARAIVEAVRAFLGDDPHRTSIRRIVLSGFARAEAAAYVLALDALYGVPLRRAALVIVDLVNTFIGDGSIIGEGDADAIIGRINGLLSVASSADVPIVYVRDVHRPTDRELVYVHRHGIEAEGSVHLHGRLRVDVGPRTLFLDKATYSAFFGTRLRDELGRLGAETVLLVGMQTHVCVKYTALHAMMHGLRPIVVEDCSTSSTPERHRHGLDEISRYFGEVSNSAFLAELLRPRS